MGMPEGSELGEGEVMDGGRGMAVGGGCLLDRWGWGSVVACV